ncbi:MAG: hypothetical protein Q8L48_20235 [Archangium sp.]|nr:hypothetical protein [Archangium sp.]
MLPEGAVIYEDAWSSIARANTTYRRLRALVAARRVPTLARRRLSNADTAMQEAATVIMRTRARGDHQLRAEIARWMSEATRCRQALRLAAERFARDEGWGPSPPTLEGILDEYAGFRLQPSPAPPARGRILLRAMIYLGIGVGLLSGLLAIVASPLAALLALLLVNLAPPVVVMAAVRLLTDPGPDGKPWQVMEAVLAVLVHSLALAIASTS